MERKEFLHKMLTLGGELEKTNIGIEITMIVTDANHLLDNFIKSLDEGKKEPITKSYASKKLLITKCNDSMMWYSNKIDEVVDFIREESDCYLSRDSSGFVNIVKKEDAKIVTVYN